MVNIKTCPYFRTFLAGLGFAVIYYFAGGLVWMHMFAAETIAHAHLWRKEEAHEMAVYLPLGSFIIGLAAAYAYRKFYSGIPGDNAFRKGLCFGVKLWLIAGLGGGIFWYALYPVTHALLLAFLIDKALGYIIGSVVIAYIFGGLLEKNKEKSAGKKSKK